MGELPQEGEGMGEYWAANGYWDVPARAAAGDGKYAGKWVHLPGMPKGPKSPAIADRQTALTWLVITLSTRCSGG